MPMTPRDVLKLAEQKMAEAGPKFIGIKGQVECSYAIEQYGPTGSEFAGLIQLGASPRATIFLTRAAKGQAFLAGRAYVTPQDVKAAFLDVMRHRVAVTYEAEAEEMTSETVLERILGTLSVP